MPVAADFVKILAQTGRGLPSVVKALAGADRLH